MKNNNKKYTFTGKTLNIYGKNFYQIKSLKDFADIREGDIGGYIEKEYNLPHDDNSWIGPNVIYGGKYQIKNSQIYAMRYNENTIIDSNIKNSYIYFGDGGCIFNSKIENSTLISYKFSLLEKTTILNSKLNNISINNSYIKNSCIKNTEKYKFRRTCIQYSKILNKNIINKNYFRDEEYK